MNPRERFLNTLNFQPLSDRLPMVEWAAWWDQTIERWKGEGLPQDITLDESLDAFGLDKLYCIGAGGISAACPQPVSHGAGIISNEADYEAMLPCLYTEQTIEDILHSALELKERHARGEVIIRLWLDGFFWHPRQLLGIQRHLYSFYDQPDLLRRINRDLAEFNLRIIHRLFPILLPDMVGFAEDMSYNHGPMLSLRAFREFLEPYYRMVIPEIKRNGVRVLIDSDGDITSMIPWMLEAGIEGVYPLERQAGVDIARIRRLYPRFLMMGGYDKMVMPQGEEAMRGEFERLLPVMQSGGYIPSVDHQTPPGVSLEDYRTYIRLFEEYARRACGEA